MRRLGERSRAGALCVVRPWKTGREATRSRRHWRERESSKTLKVEDWVGVGKQGYRKMVLGMDHDVHIKIEGREREREC